MSEQEYIKMSRCLAYNKKDRPCCNHGRVLKRTDDLVTYEATCYAHRNYFNVKKNVDEWKWLISQTLYRYDSRHNIFVSKENIHDILLAALETGVVSLKKTDDLVDTILHRENHVDFSGYVSRKIVHYLK